jgi:hypothetical protein
VPIDRSSYRARVAAATSSYYGSRTQSPEPWTLQNLSLIHQLRHLLRVPRAHASVGRER